MGGVAIGKINCLKFDDTRSPIDNNFHASNRKGNENVWCRAKWRLVEKSKINRECSSYS